MIEPIRFRVTFELEGCKHKPIMYDLTQPKAERAFEQTTAFCPDCWKVRPVKHRYAEPKLF